MKALTAVDKQLLIQTIASRALTATELAKRYKTTIEELSEFTSENREAITQVRQALEEQTPSTDATPMQLDDLWITKKFERLKRLQAVADSAYESIMFDQLIGADYATVLREFRSYLMLAANELGQLLHRGSGDSGTGDTLSVDIQGIDMETLK